MEIETKKVWDFSKENFVNRLILNDVDGKMVEHQPESEETNEIGEFDHQIQSSQMNFKNNSMIDIKGSNIDSAGMFNKKIEGINQEYNTILYTTLEN